MLSVFDQLRDEGLTWLPEYGIGYYPVTGFVYDDEYFRKYQTYAATSMGAALTEYRLSLTRRFSPDCDLVDVGVGCGQFVEARVREAPTWGFDVNVVAVAWLRERGLWRDVYAEQQSALTFWDSLEHVQHPEVLLARARRHVFVSIPIFKDAAHVLRSRHYRRDEHYWYFTEVGLAAWMSRLGFGKVYASRREEELGRVDIGTFVFERRSTGPARNGAV